MNLKVDVSQTKMTYSYNSSATPEFDDPKKIPSLGIGGWHLEEVSHSEQNITSND